jgi:hypothetical protein
MLQHFGDLGSDTIRGFPDHPFQVRRILFAIGGLNVRGHFHAFPFFPGGAR